MTVISHKERNYRNSIYRLSGHKSTKNGKQYFYLFFLHLSHLLVPQFKGSIFQISRTVREYLKTCGQAAQWKLSLHCFWMQSKLTYLERRITQFWALRPSITESSLTFRVDRYKSSFDPISFCKQSKNMKINAMHFHSLFPFFSICAVTRREMGHIL